MEKVTLALVLVEMLEGVLCGAVRSQASSEGRRTLTLLGCRARRRLRHDGRVATAVLGRADAHVQPALGLVVTADAGCLSNRFCSVLLCPCMGSIRFRSVSSPAAVLRGRRSRARWARSAFPSTDLADVLGFNFTGMSWHQLKACTAQITWFLHGIRILLFVRVGVYCRFVNGTASATRAPCGQSP